MSNLLTQTVANDGTVTISWPALAAGETGQVAAIGGYPGLKNVQLNGVFGTTPAATVALQGSNDGSTWFPLLASNLQSGAYVSLTGLTAARLDQLIDTPRFFRPVVTSGDGTTALNVSLTFPSLR